MRCSAYIPPMSTADIRFVSQEASLGPVLSFLGGSWMISYILERVFGEM